MFIVTGASAQTWNCGYPNEADVKATFSNGTLTISGTGKMEDYAIPWYGVIGKIRSVVIQNGVTSVGSYAFVVKEPETSSIVDISIGNTVETIGGSAFPECKVSFLNIPEGVKKIGYQAFSGSAITTLVIPKSVTEIVSQAFSGNSKLTDVSVSWDNPATVKVTSPCPDCGKNPFDEGKKSVTLHVPVGKKAAYQAADVWKDFNIVDDGQIVTVNHFLANLTVNAGVLSPYFHPAIHTYSVTVPRTVADITFTATPVDGATISGAGKKNLNMGENIFEITAVTSLGSSVYTITVTRHTEDRVIIDDLHLLTNLTTGAGTLSPEFSATTHAYNVIVPYNVDNILLTATPITGATVSGAGKKELDPGKNTFEIAAVMSQVSSVYTVTVTRETDPSLKPVKYTEVATGAVKAIFYNAQNQKVTIPVVDQCELEYELSTCTFSGNLPLHFDVENGKKTYDTVVNVAANSSYKFTLYLNISLQAGAAALRTNYDQYGNPASTTIVYTRHPGNVVASKGSEVLSTAEMDLIESNITKVSASKLSFTGAGNFTLYTITFNAQGGSNVTAATVYAGGKVTRPADPTRTGYTFGGWYKETACTNAWNFTTDVVNSNTTLYAKWTTASATTYSVTFNTQGGSAVASATVNAGGKITRPVDPTRTNYIFGGWYKESDCTNAWNFDTDVVNNNTSLYAKWTEKSATTYIISFDTQGGSAAASVETNAGGEVTRPADPTRSGYIFGGWFRDAACTNAWNFDTDVVTGNITLYAKWTESTTGLEIADKPLAKVYPNPTDGLFTLNFETPGKFRITITTVSSKVLQRQTISDQEKQMDISSYPSGIYLLVIDDGKQQSVTKIVKK